MSTRLPNLYQLLGLAPLEADREKIVLALKKIQARLKAARESSKTKPEDLARLQKLLALSQQLLLDADRKRQYDQDWQTAFGEALLTTTVVSAAVATTTTPASAKQPAVFWDLENLEALLPSGDPHAAFDMANYLRTSDVRDPAAAEADLNKLISLLGGEPLATSTSAPTAIAPTLSADQMMSYGTASADTVHDGSSAVSTRPSAGGNQAAATLAKRMRKRQQRSILYGGLGLIAGVAALAGLFVYLNQGPPAKQEVAQTPVKQPVGPSNNQTTNDPVTAQPMDADQANSPMPASPATGENPTRRPSNPAGAGGLLQPGQLDKPLQIQAKPVTADEMKPEMPAPTEPAPVQPAQPAMAPEKPPMTEPKPPEPTTPEPTTPEPTTPEPATPEAKPAEPASPPTADKPLSDEEKRAWLKGMKLVTNKLGKLDVTGADEQLEEMKADAKSSIQRAQHDRLVAVSVLVSNARTLIIDAILKLDAGQELTVKNTKLAFVEGDDAHIVLLQNKNYLRYKLEDLPAGIAEVLIDQNSLDSKALAAKGAYLVLHAKSTPAIANKAKQILSEAAQSGAISPELSKFYEDDYSLK